MNENNIIYFINNIIKIKTLLNYLKEDFKLLNKESFFFSNSILKIKSFIIDFENRIQELCNHKFERDLIDNGFKSSEIYYCTICGKVK